MASEQVVPLITTEGDGLRRSACDRCRGQKLRCNKENENDESCKRCERAKVQCITNPPLPMGRPPLSSLDTDRAPASRKKQATGCKKRRLTATSSAQSTPTPDQPTTMSALNPGDPCFINSNNEAFSELFNSVGLDGDFATIDSNFMQPTINAMPSFAGYAHHGISNIKSGPPDPFSAISACRSNENVVNRPVSSDTQPTALDTDPGEDFMQELSTLNLKLYRQLKNIKSGYWCELLRSSASSCNSSEPTGAMFSPIDSLLSSSKDFAEIVDQILPSASSGSPSTMTSTLNLPTPTTFPHDGSDSLRQTTSDSQDPPIFACNQHYTNSAPFTGSATNTATRCPTFPSSDSTAGNGPMQSADTAALLLILTCYLRLIRIYSYLFARLDEMLISSSAAIPCLPGVFIGGFQLHGSMQMMILVQVCACMIDRVEGALGLDDSRRGWGDRVSKTLLETVMKREEMEGGTRGLRDDIRTVKRLLSERLAQ